MKYSFMSFSSVEADLSKLILLAKEYGYHGIELRVGSGHSHGVDINMSEKKISDIKKMFDKENISVSCIATSCIMHGFTDKMKNIEDAKKSIDLAYGLNAPVIRVFGGAYPDNKTREEAESSLAETLSEIAEYAEKKQVTVCLETHDAWTNPNHVVNVLEKVNSPYVAANWDILHPVRQDGMSIEESYEIIKKWIKHVHIHDADLSTGKSAFVPIGTGNVNHKKAISLLTKDGYSGYLSGEWIGWEPAEIHLPREIETMKKYEKQIGGNL